MVSYDGSADAQAAINHAAQLMPVPGRGVLTSWQPYIDAMLTYSGSMGVGAGMAGAYGDAQDVDAVSEQRVLETADEGAHAPPTAGSSPSLGSPAGTAASRGRSSPRPPTWTLASSSSGRAAAAA